MDAAYGISFSTSQSLIITSLVLVVIASIGFVRSIRHPPFPSNSPHRLFGLPLLGNIDTLTNPWGIFQRGVSASLTGNFSFSLGRYQVIGVSSDAARTVFFMNPHLVSGAGYGAIYGELGDDDVRSKNEKITITTVKALMATDRLEAAMPQMLVDVNTWLDNLGSSGILNPSRVIQNIIVQLTVRTFGCDEMGNDPKLRDRAFSIIETSDNGHALATFLFPWLPLPKIMSKMWSGVVLYWTLRRIVRARATTGKRGADALQFLLDQGISIISIVEVIFGALFAGVSNSAGVSSWLLYYLSTNPVWMARVRAELIQLGAKYAQASDQQAPLSKQLLSVPLEGWESEVPTLDLCVKETIRMFIQAPFMRKNISRDQVVIDKDEVVAPGAIMLFYTAAVMMNPEIYKDPQVWDPARYLPDRAEDKSGQHVWVGWGSGKHPCRGMRFGKLEQNIIAALFIARFDYDLLDTGRSKVQEPLRPSPRAFQFTKPLNFSFSYKAV